MIKLSKTFGQVLLVQCNAIFSAIFLAKQYSIEIGNMLQFRRQSDGLRKHL